MENIAITLSHDGRHRTLVQLVIHFFKFVGLLALEDGPGDKFDRTNNDLYKKDTPAGQEPTNVLPGVTEFSFVLDGSVSTRKAHRILLVDYPSLTCLTLDGVQLGQEEVRKEVTGLFRELFGMIQEKMPDYPVDMVMELLDVYMDTCAIVAFTNLQYYPGISILHKRTKEILLDTVVGLESLKDRYPFLCSSDPDGISSAESWAYVTFHFAVLYCKQKTNLVCWFLKDGEYNMRRGDGKLCNKNGFLREVKLKYRVSELFRDCKKLIEQYPQNANLYVLMGMVTERASDGYQVAADAYQQALGMIGNRPYASHIYYSLSQLHERNKNLPEAKKTYASAYLIGENYRNIYKVAVMFEREKNYGRFHEYLVMCCESLAAEENRMDPLEMEYYCKACILLCVRSFQYRNDADTAIQYGEEALRFFREHIQDDAYGEFMELYGNAMADYQAESQERISFRMVYETLAVAYKMNDDMEKSEEYRKKYTLGRL